eukprot:381940_1
MNSIYVCMSNNEIRFKFLSISHYSFSNIQKQCIRTLNCQSAIKLIKARHYENDNKNKSSLSDSKVINEIFDIYKQTENDKNHHLFNVVLKSCSNSKYFQQISMLYDDIKNYENKNLIQLALLFKCLIQSKTIDINKAINVLQWVNDYNHMHCINQKDIVKLIINCNHLQQLKDIHALIESNNLLQPNIYLQTSLIKSYGHFGEIEIALKLFEQMNSSQINAVAFNSVMTALINNNCIQKAMEMYDNAQFKHVKDDISHLLAIKCCISNKNYERGKHIHTQEISPTKEPIIELTSILIEFYGKCGDVKNAQLLFDGIKTEKINVICVGAMMKAFINNNKSHEALKLFKQFDSMRNYIIDSLAIKACINTNDYNIGKVICNEIDKNHNDLSIKTSLIEFYGHFSDVNNALNIFNSIKQNKKNSIVIGAIIKALINNNQYHKAIELYMKYKCFHNDILHNLALTACIKNNN